MEDGDADVSCVFKCGLIRIMGRLVNEGANWLMLCIDGGKMFKMHGMSEWHGIDQN